MNSLRFFSTLTLLALLAACTGFQRKPAQPTPLSACPWQSAADLAKNKDLLGPSSDSNTLACALTVLRNAEDSELLRTALGSRLSLHLAERETDRNRRNQFATEGVEFAEAALAKDADKDGAVHYYLAANLGLVLRDNLLLAAQNLGRLEREMKLALALSPNLDAGGPLRLLGALYLKAPAWPSGIGDLDKALELLEKAVKEHPEHPINHLFYAQALWSAGDETSQTQAKNECLIGRKLLAEGDWGYTKETWEKEFDLFAKEIGES